MRIAVTHGFVYHPCQAHGSDENRGRQGTVTLIGACHSLASSDPSSGRHARALPGVERYGSKLFVHGSFEEMALVIESVVGRRMDVEEALRRAG